MNYCLRPLASLPLLLAISLLTACGFHLRGQMDINSELANVSVVGNDTGYVRQLTRTLNNAGFHVIPDAPYKINILSVDQKVGERTHSTAGFHEKLLQLKVTYQLATDDNLPLFEPVELTAERYVSEDENLINASASENKLVYEELREDLLFRMMNTLAAMPTDKLQQEVERARKVAEQEQQQRQQRNDA